MAATKSARGGDELDPPPRLGLLAEFPQPATLGNVVGITGDLCPWMLGANMEAQWIRLADGKEVDLGSTGFRWLLRCCSTCRAGPAHLAAGPGRRLQVIRADLCGYGLPALPAA
jgi:hypothetical protein